MGNPRKAKLKKFSAFVCDFDFGLYFSGNE